MTTETTSGIIRIYCDRLPEHERRGKTWIEQMIRVAVAKDGSGEWGTRQVPRAKKRHGDWKEGNGGFERWLHADHESTERLIGPDGAVLSPGERDARHWHRAARIERRKLECGDRAVKGLPEAPGLSAQLVAIPLPMDGEPGIAGRLVYDMKCACGFALQVRAETLWPALDKIAAANVAQISIVKLSRVVS